MMNYTECAMELFPMRLVAGEYDMGNNLVKQIPGGRILHNGWGRTGGFVLTEDEKDIIPQGAKLLWYSLVEDTFFTCDYIFKPDSLEEALNRGMISPVSGSAVSFDTLILGLAPAGHVSIWLSGEGVTRKVMEFYGTKTKVDWARMKEPLGRMQDAYRSEVIRKKLKPEHLKLTTKVSDFKVFIHRLFLEMDYQLQILTPAFYKNCWISFQNGERLFYDEDNTGVLRTAIPRRIEVNWESLSGQKFQTRIDIDPEEWYKVISYYIYKGHDVTATIELRTETGTASVFLANDKEFTRLESVRSVKYLMR